MIEKNIRRILIGLKQHGDSVVQLVTGESRAEQVWHLINLQHWYWKDPLHFLTTSFDLIRCEGYTGEKAYEISAEVYDYVSEHLQSDDEKLFGMLSSVIQGKQVHYEFEEEFKKLSQ